MILMICDIKNMNKCKEITAVKTQIMQVRKESQQNSGFAGIRTLTSAIPV